MIPNACRKRKKMCPNKLTLCTAIAITISIKPYPNFGSASHCTAIVINKRICRCTFFFPAWLSPRIQCVCLVQWTDGVPFSTLQKNIRIHSSPLFTFIFLKKNKKNLLIQTLLCERERKYNKQQQKCNTYTEERSFGHAEPHQSIFLSSASNMPKTTTAHVSTHMNCRCSMLVLM